MGEPSRADVMTGALKVYGEVSQALGRLPAGIDERAAALDECIDDLEILAKTARDYEWTTMQDRINRLLEKHSIDPARLPAVASGGG